MQKEWYELIAAGQQKKELSRLLSCNEKSAQYGLVLTEEEALKLLTCRNEALMEQGRVEFGGGILPALMEAFCDSDYITQDEFADTLADLQEVFYLYKNEANENLTDEELITFMREQFDDVCCGSVEYLEETCLERFARAVRAGYDDFIQSGGSCEYERFSEEMRWDKELFLQVYYELLG